MSNTSATSPVVPSPSNLTTPNTVASSSAVKVDTPPSAEAHRTQNTPERGRLLARKAAMLRELSNESSVKPGLLYSSLPNTVFVGGLNSSVSDERLRRTFGTYGEIRAIDTRCTSGMPIKTTHASYDQHDGINMYYASIMFVDPIDARKALAHDGNVVHDEGGARCIVKVTYNANELDEIRDVVDGEAAARCDLVISCSPKLRRERTHKIAPPSPSPTRRRTTIKREGALPQLSPIALQAKARVKKEKAAEKSAVASARMRE